MSVNIVQTAGGFQHLLPGKIIYFSLYILQLANKYLLVNENSQGLFFSGLQFVYFVQVDCQGYLNKST